MHGIGGKEGLVGDQQLNADIEIVRVAGEYSRLEELFGKRRPRQDFVCDIAAVLGGYGKVLVLLIKKWLESSSLSIINLHSFQSIKR